MKLKETIAALVWILTLFPSLCFSQQFSVEDHSILTMLEAELLLPGRTFQLKAMLPSSWEHPFS